MATSPADPDASAHFPVEVAYALPDRQVVLPLTVSRGTTVEQAIMRSGILHQFPDIDLRTQAVGIYGTVVELQRPLQPEDRVEIYRPLLVDPKEVRKQRAQRRG
ncbi:MAG: RnfH family protein [Ectothiorhodospiraceae bacterium]|nr:RnfH family protein [Ectothiorhodospiraceae bacterium]